MDVVHSKNGVPHLQNAFERKVGRIPLEAVEVPEFIRRSMFMALIDTKSAITSTSIWGGLIAFLPVLDYVGQFIAGLPAGLLPAPAMAVISAIGGIIAIIGRVKATKTITSIV